MTKYFLLILFLLPVVCSAQTSKYFVSFTDKNNSPYSVSNPSAYLSSRAIARRINQGIAIDQSDIPVDPAYVDSVVSKGAIVFTRSKWFNGVTVEADTPTIQAVQLLPFVQQVTVVHRSSIHQQGTPDLETKFEMPMNRLVNISASVQSLNYGQSFNQIHIMNGDFLHDAGYHGENMIIAVLDAGFFRVDSLPAFDSLRINNQILGTWDFVQNETSVYEDYNHGMSVLSTIAGNIPGQLVGTAPKALFWLLRTEDFYSERRIEEYNWDAGAEFADSAGADVITTSLGYSDHFSDPSEDHTYAEMDGHTTVSAIAANIAFSRGMLVIASAGNSGGSSYQYISSPADGDSVMAVGAVDGGGNYGSFSSTGPSADGDVKPNVAAVGVGTTISYSSGNIGTGNGTSFACPVLAGSATCLWQAFPAKTNREIFDAIQRSASQFLSPDSLLGYGIPDFMTANQLLGGIEIKNQIHDDLASVYPNPFKDDVEIKFYSSSNQHVTIEVVDALGRIVFQKNQEAASGSFSVITLPLANLQSAIYFVKITTARNSFVRRVMKY